MSERHEHEPQPIKQIDFADLQEGDVIHITTGKMDETYRYDFEVDASKGHHLWPMGTLTETRPDGTIAGPIPMSLHGCGKWTNRKQNPVQEQERAFTPYYEGLLLGSFMIGAIPGAKDGERLVFDSPGQQITELGVSRAKK